LCSVVAFWEILQTSENRDPVVVTLPIGPSPLTHMGFMGK